MRLPKAKQLPSGEWYMQVSVDGQRYNKAFPTKEEAEYWAAGLKTRSIEYHRSPSALTVTAAIDRYIDSKPGILSPSTVRGYRRMQKHELSEIANVPLKDLTQERVQRWVSNLSKSQSPKTVANAHGLLSVILREYKPSMALRTSLPQKVKKEVKIPTESELKKIMFGCKGKKYELPIMLAIWLGLRASEILGLKWTDIEGDYIRIQRAVVTGEDGPVEKGTKTYSGTRTIHIPAYIKQLLDAQPRNKEHIINMSEKAIYSGFVRICQKQGLPHFRFHDLRHVNASLMLAVGAPDKYAMKRMGHATNNMLKTVYQHTIKEKELIYDTQLETYLDKLTPDE